MTGEPRSHYVHGSTPIEQARLERMNAYLNDRALAELGLAGDETVLDVGAGTALFALRMAKRARRVVAIERDPAQLAVAREHLARTGATNLDLREGDVHDLPLTGAERGAFDVAHARFLLEHVPDPLAVVRAMVAAVRPGGRIVLADDDHPVLRLEPELPSVVRAWDAYMRAFEAHGNDPRIGRKLVGLLHEAGAEPTRNTLLFFGSCSGDAVFETIVENLIGVMEGARADMVRLGDFDAADLDRASADLRAFAARPDAAFWYEVCWAEGRRPGGAVDV